MTYSASLPMLAMACTCDVASLVYVLWVLLILPGLQADVRHFSSHFMGNEAILDLGRPQTPRKDGDGNLEVALSQNIPTLGDGSVTVATVSGGDNQGAQQAGAPVADSVGLLSSRRELPSVRQATELSSVIITMEGQISAKMNLADVRKQLMMMGLFPAELYGVGESFEETLFRY